MTENQTKDFFVEPLISRRVFDSLSEQILVVDTRNFTIVDANKALLEALKMKREEVIGKTCFEITHNRSTPCESPMDICPLGEMLKTGNPLTVEHTHYTSTGEPFYVEVSATPIKGKEGNTVYAIHISRDITDRKKLEKQLLRFKLGVERAGEIVFLTGKDGTIVYVNPMFEKVYGYAKEEALGKTPRILKSGTLPNEVYKHFWDTLLANQIQSGEIINKTKENRLLTIESTASPISDEHGEIIGFLAIQRDVTERKKIEEDLKQSEDHLNMAQKIAHLGSWEYYVKEDKAIWSKELFRIFGLKPQPYGPNVQSYINLIYPEDRRKVQQQVTELNRKSGEHVSYDYRIVLPDGSIRHIHSESTIREVDEQGIPKRVVGIEQDITERKQIEEKLQQYSENLQKIVEERTKQLRDSERLAAIGEVAGMVGHDIRSPLQTIVNEIYFAKESMANAPSEVKQVALESIDTMEKQVDYINRILADLQDLAKQKKPELTQINICQIISDILKTLSIPSRIQVSQICEKEAILGNLDPTFMSRILINLVNNALQAMPNIGNLTIEASKKEEKMLISIEDTGMGITEEAKAKIFTPLFSTKAKGQGFGLAAVKRLVEAQSGTIHFESQAGKGTKFIIELPINLKN